jgi:hypothetical protein
MTEKPDEAEVFLFPWDIGKYIDGGQSAPIWELIGSLPYFTGREMRHIVCDNGDFTLPPELPVCLVKISVTNALAEQCVPMPHFLPEHMFLASPSFDWDAVRYDASFVGNMTHVARRAMVASVRRQAPELRFFVDFDDNFIIRGRYYFSTRSHPDAAKTARRQELYRESLKKTLTVLCPPGVGPHTFRMYETMYMGRIPVLFRDDAVFPLERLVAYEDFCFFLPREEIMNTGLLLKAWLRGKTREELRERCALACRTWNRYFAPDKVLPLLLDEIRRKWRRSLVL